MMTPPRPSSTYDSPPAGYSPRPRCQAAPGVVWRLRLPTLDTLLLLARSALPQETPRPPTPRADVKRRSLAAMGADTFIDPRETSTRRAGTTPQRASPR